MFDVLIIGGSYAGMAAAMQLGRARRSVLVVDGGQRRNRFASHAHGFLGHDGQPPDELARQARAQVLAYPSVRWQDAQVTAARADADAFLVQAGAEQHRARRLILATGVTDDFPPLPGLEERWGRTVFHCPYCHGYELRRGRLGVLVTSELVLHHAPLVAEWAGPGQFCLFFDGSYQPAADQLAALEARGLRVERERVVALQGTAPSLELQLQGGRLERLDGLFLSTRTHVNAELARQLGCELEPGMTLGTQYKTDMMKETTVPGVFACGDAAANGGAIAMAVAEGTRAGVGAHRSLVFPR